MGGTTTDDSVDMEDMDEMTAIFVLKYCYVCHGRKEFITSDPCCMNCNYEFARLHLGISEESITPRCSASQRCGDVHKCTKCLFLKTYHDAAQQPEIIAAALVERRRRAVLLADDD